MGSVGSGVAGEQEFAMKSVGTRTTLPRAPPLSRRCPDRSCSAERLPRPPPTVSDGTASSEERGSVSIGTGTCTGTERPTETASSTNTECTVANPDMAAARADGDANPASQNPPSHNPPKILPVSGKLEQSFHSMQNLVVQSGGAGGEGKADGRSEGMSEGRGGRRGRDGGEAGEVPEALLLDQDSPIRAGRIEGGAMGNEIVQGGGMSDSGRNSLTSLPTYTGSGSGYGPPAVLGPLSASTSHINRLGTAGAAAGLEKLEKPGYQNGLSTSDSGRSSSGKSSSSYQRLSHLSDAPAPLRPSPSSDDIIQDLEDRLWEKEQEVQHIRRNLDQSEAAIIQVFEEKQRVWERQMDELRQNYASRLQQVTRRAQRSQTALQAQITRLSQDKRRLQEEMAALLAQREELERKCLDYRKEQADILPRLEETKWEVCQKAGEISLLKQQLRESQAEVSMLREKLGVFEAEVLSLKRALNEVGRGHEISMGPNLAAAGLLPPWGMMHCPRTSSEPSSVPLSSTSDNLLSLQSDEAKAQRQEAQRQQREEAQWREAQHRQDAHISQDLHMRQEAQLRQEAQVRHEVQLRQEAQMRQDAQMRQEVQLRQEAQLRQEVQLRQEAQHRQEGQLRQELQLRQDSQLCQELQLRQAGDEAGDLRRQLEQLQATLRLERQQRERQALNFDQERHTWQDEKERVLKYQAQLQLSYVETLQKNQALEKRMGQMGTKAAPNTTATSGSCSGSASTSASATPSTSSSGSPPPPPPPPPPPAAPPAALSPLSSQATASLQSPIALTLSPPCEEQKGPPSLHQLAPPWVGPTRLERIESTEI
ncbi:hypothetical protein NHX12_028629 [Muraenolepis orangiensis]|uniref:Leucine zipper tumor suppressor 3 n=1 Tax=Muraenolepis orangiensis TaxID=630683 RepID=A0A9Q0EE31_9TELE|nr:hypothetical protein NHX12_028629 [Muraenolepis orangiensis]